MAKDGSNRGGARPGAGRPRKAPADKIADGNSGRPITVLSPVAELEGSDMPKIKEYLTEEQKIGIELEADTIFKYVWNWLKDWKCEKFISPEIIEHYALSAARHIQAEKLISRTDFLAKHPTTGAPIQSPYVAISHSYEKAANNKISLAVKIVYCNGNAIKQFNFFRFGNISLVPIYSSVLCTLNQGTVMRMRVEM